MRSVTNLMNQPVQQPVQHPVVVQSVPSNIRQINFKAGEVDQFLRSQSGDNKGRPSAVPRRMSQQDMMAQMMMERQKEQKKVTNFELKLPSPQSELALQTMKDPYIFDFIELKENSKEKDLEEALINNITKVLLEFGKGFAYVGHQYHLEIAGEDYYIDLLFYNIKLKCYFVIELKIGEFKPEYAGQLSFYLTAIDEQIKDVNDNPTIGLLLCRYKNNVIAEYTLRDMNKPMGVSEYRIKDYLPSIEELITIVEKEI